MKKRSGKLLVGAALFLVALLLPAEPAALKFAAYLVAYLVIGYQVLRKAFNNIKRGKVFDENFLMAVASIGAFATGEYPEAVAVMLFYQIGELFEDYAVGKSRKSITELMNIRPDYANLKLADGETEKVDPDEVKIGDIIVVKPGEKVPLDGVVLSGSSMLDTAALTGESVPRSVREGEEILSGCINQNGLLEVEVKKAFGESTVSKILELVESATSQKAKMENFITRFAGYYTPAVVGAAVVLALLPPILIGSGFLGGATGFSGALFKKWVYRALEFLVVSCPCALVISVPLSFFGGIGGASKIGLLVKGSNYLEAAAYTEYVVMDKTGTLTKGVFKVETVENCGKLSKEELLKYAAYAEANSSHPISVSLREAYEAQGTESASGTVAQGAAADTEEQGSRKIDKSLIGSVEEIAGHGVAAEIEGHKVFAGNQKLMKRENIVFEAKDITGTVVHVAVDDNYEGYITIADQIKEDAAKAIKGLKARGIKTVMLTGDSRAVAESVGKTLGLDEVHAELLPENKVEEVEKLLAAKSEKGKLMFVGDGINDAPVLARADVGVAMGGLGSDAAIEAADVVIMTDEPSKLLNLMDIAKKTLSIAKQNVVFALTVKLLVLILCAVGLVNMWAAVFADVGVSVLAILNAMRALKVAEE